MNPRLKMPVIFFLLLFLPVFFINAQEDEPEPEPGPETGVLAPVPDPAADALTQEQNRIDMDIRTSTLSELAAWARSLKLPETGTSADLAKRIRDYYSIAEKGQAGVEDKRKIITIESTRTAEYFKIETIDEEYARLTGDVIISLKDGDAVHRISAWNVLFNRTRNIITASGGVEYIREEGEKIETFRGDSITVDINNWSSVFLGGTSERALQRDDTTYLFAGDVISRDDEEVTVLSKAVISGARNPDSLWSISASRVWLLPGSDFAILNAVLKVGAIPVLYIPFFHYAADEVIFHPVIGSRTREGHFIQTTTYILGRPKAAAGTQSSLVKILGNSNDMIKRREGMFLRSTGKKKTDPDKVSLKAMVDYYVNLGAYIGADLELPAFNVFGVTSVSAGIGLTRTLAPLNGSYTPYFPNYDGETDWNRSNLFSFDVPFRYRFKGSNSISGKYGNFSLSLPFYSDPMVDNDFLNRSEEMDWINMIQQGASTPESQNASENQIGPYTWQINGQLTPQIPALAPYINSISLSSFSSTVAFRTMDIRSKYSTNDIKYHSPSSFFFAPDTATVYQISGLISGVPLSLGQPVSRTTVADADKTEIEDPLKGIGIPRSPFEEKVINETLKKDTTDRLVPPALNQRFDLPKTGNNRFTIDYRMSPQSSSILRFDSRNWKEYNDISWKDVSNMMSNFGGDAGTNFTFSHSEGLYSSTFSFTGIGTWRQYSYLNEDAKEYELSGGTGPDRQKIASDKLQESRQSYFSTSYASETKIWPFFRNAIFKQSYLAYNLTGLAVKSKFVEEDMSAITDPNERIDFLESWAKNPEWEMEWGDWVKEKINTHSLTANVSASIMDKQQTFSMSAELPPRDTKLSWNTALRAWITETNADWGMHNPEEQETWKLDPFNLTERLIFGNFGIFTFNMKMDSEGWDSPDTGTMMKRLNSITTSLNLTKWGVTAAFSASQMLGYEYIAGGSGNTGWTQRKGDENLILRPRDFSLTYKKNTAMKELWKNRLDFSLNVDSRLYIDLQQYTNSNFSFNLGFTLDISNFLSLVISAESANARVYQYFHNWPLFRNADIDLPDSTETNIFIDLFNSFRFDDEELRKKSGFKMKSFQISAVHHLGDWNAELTWKIMPYRPQGVRRYEINNEVAFLLKWIPVSEIKSDIKYNKVKSPEWVMKGL